MAPVNTAVSLLCIAIVVFANRDYASVKKEAVSLTLSPNHESGLWSRDVGSEQECPARVRVNIKHNKRDVTLNLQRNDDNQFAAPLLVNDGKRLQAVHLPASGCFYGDDHSDIVLRPHSDGMRVSGRYVTPDGVYGLETNESLHHLAYQIATGNTAESLMQSSFTKRNITKRAAKYYVEIMPVFGYDVYKLHLQLNDNNERKTMESIKFYCTQVMNEVAYVYKRSDTGIVVALSACTVLKSKQESHCIEKSTYDDVNEATGRQGILGRKFLDLCSVYAIENLPAADHYMFITTYDLWSDGYGLKGLAWIGAACTNTRVSVVQDQGVHFTSTVAAHELGHNLGAEHDGAPLHKDCPSEEQNNMCPYIDSSSVNYKLNALFFSACSKQDFNDYLSTADCVKNKPDLNKYSNYNKPLLSSKYDLNEQCQQTTAFVDSKYCGGSNISQVCVAMKCIHPSTGECSIKNLAYDRTSCGNKKWCVNNVCVEDRNAPEVKECAHGDVMDIFRFTMASGTIATYNCQEAAKKHAGFCYNEKYRAQCCASCAREFKGRPASCPYGDHFSYCAGMKPNQCYSQQQDCCATCPTLKKNDGECKWGDRGGDACANMKPGECNAEDMRSDCCETCAKLKTSDADCPYGDLSERCSRVESNQCMDSTVKKECCIACRKFDTGDKDCPHGDLMGGGQCKRIQPRDCYNDYYAKQCCATCKAFGA